jgi:hypothetical protein
MLGRCCTDPVHADFTEAGSVAADFARDDLVGLIGSAISGFTATQHLNPNHVIEFDVDDAARAVCYSSMYAQPRGSPGAVTSSSCAGPTTTTCAARRMAGGSSA